MDTGWELLAPRFVQRWFFDQSNNGWQLDDIDDEFHDVDMNLLRSQCLLCVWRPEHVKPHLKGDTIKAAAV